MKISIKLLIGTVILMHVFNACHDPDLMPAPEPEWAPVAVVQWTDENKAFYNYADIENAEFEYVLYGEDFGYEEASVSEIDVYLSMNGAGKKLWQTYSDFPVTVNLPASAAASEFGLTAADLEVGDVFTFSYVVKTLDGRVFDLYGNNICNLIRVEGICSLQAYVLTPSIPEATVSSDNSFSVSEITASGDDLYSFDFSRRDFISVDLTEIDVELSYTSSSGTSDFITLENLDPGAVPTFVDISASEAAALFGLTAGDLEVGDVFTVMFTFEESSVSFTNFGSALCGVDFPSTIVYPYHNGITGTIPDLGFENPLGVATAPPATSTTGTCSLTIPVTE